MPESMIAMPMPVDPVNVDEVATAGKPSVWRSVVVTIGEESRVETVESSVEDVAFNVEVSES